MLDEDRSTFHPDGEAEQPESATHGEPSSTTSPAMGLALAATAATLASCGGGGGSSASTSSSTSTPTPPPVVTPAWSAPADAAYARFLQQSQFDSSEADIAAVKAKGYATWLDEQMALPSSQSGWDWLNARGYGVIDMRNFAQADFYIVDYMIWNQIIRSPDQVRRRIALAMTEYFVVNVDNMTEPWFKSFHIAKFFEILCDNAFGNFRKLLEEVTLSVAMGAFLNTLRNEKEDPVTGRQPDENYAREVMQLFTLGVSQLNIDGTPKLDASGNPIDTYTQSDVTNLARVFTGYDTDQNAGFTKSPVPPFFFTIPNVGYTRNPMKFYSFRHSLLEKKFLGVTIPANTDGPASLKIALDTLFNHPNVGPFFARQMIQRLVTSNPSPAYVKRIATVFNDNGSGVRGDLKAVFKAILLDDDARSSTNLTSPSHGKLREPMLRFAQWARTFKLNSKRGTWKIKPPDYGATTLAQTPFRASSVFNFFRPGYIPPNTQFAADKATAPEYQIVNESTVSQYVNFMQSVLPNGLYVTAPELIEQPMMSTSTDGFDLVPDYSAELALVTDPTALVRRLSLLLAAGRLSQATETTIVNALKSDNITASSSDTAKLYNVCRGILFVMSATEYLVQK